MYSFVLLRERSRAFPQLISSLTFTRSMGGGPRTFPGGLNKWQWKRFHEKKAKEKQKKLLDQEKQLYQARIRSQIRAKLAGKPEPESESTSFIPMSPKDQIKALADRFMKPGAEDLWNEDDGPIEPIQRSRRVQQSVDPPIDLRKMFLDRRNLVGDRENVNSRMDFSSCSRPRYYSRFRVWRNESSVSNLELVVGRRNLASNCGSVNLMTNFSSSLRPRYYSRFRFRRNENSDSDSASDEDYLRPFVGESVGNPRWPRMNLSEMNSESSENDSDHKGRRNYDVKKKRIMPKFDEEEPEEDLSQQVEWIRREVNQRILLADAVETTEEEVSILSNKRFNECNISPLTIKALSEAGFVQMTWVQEATLSAYLEGKDAFVKAKTGTGKSVAFLVPAIETVLRASVSSISQRVLPIDVLILCPTRELASQIAAEATVMLRYHDGIGVQTLVGGTRFKVDQKRLESDPCQIIVATPGRLLDHIENKSGISVRLMGLKMLILDEADHLLDLGFRKDIEKIVDCLPRQRQALLFSATVPKEVRRISQLVLKREHAFLDTVGLGSLETHEKVKQSYLVAPHGLHLQILYHLLKEHISQVTDYKVIVFCTTGMMTSFIYLLLRELNMNAREIHSRKPQLYRTRISEEFRASNQLILVTSDVSARGMNYPDVTLVIQVGLPSDREQYIHRLGRTGRAGKEGEGILLLAPWEEYFLSEIKDLPIEKVPVPQLNPDIKLQINASMEKIDTSVKEAAYHAWLGFYNSIREIGRDKTALVELAKSFSASIGLQNPPSLFRKTAVKMGLRNIPGIRIRK
ncbi:Helicase, C-terminal [Dillenia turbinata]|uniref:ATP-dependent RNA helicase n=1 Tax=Dillenia turbinata TaxID=194707 RepID=A0AAN8W9S5_9MAGN